MDSLRELGGRFGDRLTLVRDGSRARWFYDGLTASVEIDGQSVRASFVDRPMRDVATSQTCAAVYRATGADYALSAGGRERLARDVADFFNGVREPRFAFAAVSSDCDLYPLTSS